MQEAEQILRSRLNFQGTTMGFSTERRDFLWWLLVSTDGNAARALLSLMDSPAWREDIPRMARGALGRQLRGRWDTTVANAWGVLAMEKFSKAFRSCPDAVALEGEEIEVKAPPPFGAMGHGPGQQARVHAVQQRKVCPHLRLQQAPVGLLLRRARGPAASAAGAHDSSSVGPAPSAA